MFTVVKFCRHRAATCGREKRKVREGPPCSSLPPLVSALAFQTYPKSQKPLVIYYRLCENISSMLPLFNDNVSAAGIVFIIS